jgi:hypothetical protein
MILAEYVQTTGGGDKKGRLDLISKRQLLLNLPVTLCIRQKCRAGEGEFSYYLDKVIFTIQYYHSEELTLYAL